MAINFGLVLGNLHAKSERQTDGEVCMEINLFAE